jgi:hypothetical protein
MTLIFISHATKDDPSVDRIYQALAAANLPAWVDHINAISAGDDWHQAIQDGLNACTSGLFVLSPHSAQSEECTNEWRTIQALKKPLHVALIAPVPDELFPYRLRTIQYVDLQAFDKGLPHLIQALGGKPKPAPISSPSTTESILFTGQAAYFINMLLVSRGVLTVSTHKLSFVPLLMQLQRKAASIPISNMVEVGQGSRAFEPTLKIRTQDGQEHHFSMPNGGLENVISLLQGLL